MLEQIQFLIEIPKRIKEKHWNGLMKRVFFFQWDNVYFYDIEQRMTILAWEIKKRKRREQSFRASLTVYIMLFLFLFFIFLCYNGNSIRPGGREDSFPIQSRCQRMSNLPGEYAKQPRLQVEFTSKSRAKLLWKFKCYRVIVRLDVYLRREGTDSMHSG